MKNAPIILFTILLFFTAGMFAADSEFASNTISVGVIVSDLDKSIDFYTNIIGMQKTGSFDVDAATSKKTGLANGVPFHVEVLKLGEGEGATEWKLMTFGKDSKKQQNRFIQDHTGMQYVTIFVNSLQPALKRIKKNNVKLLGDTPVQLDEKNHFMHFCK